MKVKYFISLLALFILFSPQSLAQFKTKNVGIEGNKEEIQKFIKVLKSNKKVRIAHYGDSTIQGDIISEYLRQYFQEKFGGKGAGIVEAKTLNPLLRKSILLSSSNDWENASIRELTTKKFPIGIAGSVASSSDNSWVKIKSSGRFKNLDDYTNIKILYSNANSNSKVKITTDSKADEIKLENKNKISQVNYVVNKTKNVSLDFINSKNLFVYGISLETENGIHLDNFPLVGNSGVSLLNITESVLNELKEFVTYDLIILNFGINVSFPNKNGYKVYENKMVEVVNHFKKIFPDASFLLVSTGDRIKKIKSTFKSDPEVFSVLEAQKEVVAKTKIAFWNLWEMMGGENSMVSWVEHKPSLALKDYTHFNDKGGEYVAKMLFEAIMNEYNK